MAGEDKRPPFDSIMGGKAGPLREQRGSTTPVPGSYADPNIPLDPGTVPDHMREAILTPDQLAALSDQEHNSSPPTRISDLPVATRKRIEGQVLNPEELGLSDDTEEKEDNVIGVNPNTGMQIVTPSKVSTSVFGRPQATVVDAFEGRSFEEVMRHVQQVTDYREMTLPSRGYLYPKALPFSSGEVLVRPMKSEEEEIILNASLLKSGQVIERILKRCVMVGQNMELKDPLQLLSQDRTALLIFIRGLTMGAIYEANFGCPRCGHSFEVNIDLDNDLDSMFCDDPEIREPFKGILPQTHLAFEYRLSRGTDDYAVIQHIEERQKRKGLKAKEDGLRFKVSRLVVGIQGCVTAEQREKVLGELSIQDLDYIRKLVDFPPFGVNTVVTTVCPKCQSESRSRMPMSVDFYSPQLATPKSNEQSQSPEQD